MLILLSKLDYVEISEVIVQKINTGCHHNEIIGASS